MKIDQRINVLSHKTRQDKTRRDSLPPDIKITLKSSFFFVDWIVLYQTQFPFPQAVDNLAAIRFKYGVVLG